ncbi:hypothetical protein MJO29_002101 [Puccinia striiformis f. sp. tritici]|nr:hypothetical protein MJO29_002101 [Puccinia striiformis f. sp. tritici]
MTEDPSCQPQRRKTHAEIEDKTKQLTGTLWNGGLCPSRNWVIGRFEGRSSDKADPRITTRSAVNQKTVHLR